MRVPAFEANHPLRRAAGWGVVLVVHLLAGWALLSGTARQALDSLKKPLEAVVIQEVSIAPPPPAPPQPIEPPQAPQPPLQKTPPPFVPPPVAPLPATAPVIAAAPVPAPPVPAVVAPAPVPVPAAPRPVRAEMGSLCPSQVRPEMPPQAIRQGIEGVVRAEAVIRDGVVREVNILSGPRVFHASVRNAMQQYRCVKEAGETRAVQEFAFKLE